jgi:chromosome partitioning protein
MRTIAFLTQKGGTGKTTLAASVAVSAAGAGENVIALDLDPQGSLVRWGARREAVDTRDKVIVDLLERERLPQLPKILHGLADVGFTVAIFDTAGADPSAIRLVTEAVDLCLLPVRPSLLDIEASIATFRTAYLAKRKAAFVLNQCPPAHHSARAKAAAKALGELGVLAEPMLSTRMDFQDAIAAGFGVTEYARNGRAAQEIAQLWAWISSQICEHQLEAGSNLRVRRLPHSARAA